MPATLTLSSTEATTVKQALPVFAHSISPDMSLNITQLRLMHHYTTVTAKTLAHDASSERVFTTNLVQTAFNYAFLLHALLALGALHLSCTEEVHGPTHAEYRRLAEKHHDAALSDFRATVRDIDHTNWKAVLLFAGTLFPYSCSASVSACNDLDLEFDNFLSNLALTRRVRPMVSGFYDEMLRSELAHMIPNDVRGIDWKAKEAPVDTEYVSLRHFLCVLEACELCSIV
jgi:hypothetical protein